MQQLIPKEGESVEAGGRFDLCEPFSDGTNSGGLKILWKFICRPIDLPVKGTGAYIRLNVGGRDVPTYIIQRTSNWGFKMENCWGLFASFPLPPKRQEPQVASRSLRQQSRIRTRRSSDHNAGPSAKRPRMTIEAMLDDAALTVTDQGQWREALLYNLGASQLPDDDSDSFDAGQAFDDNGSVWSTSDIAT